jgi:hypothetical protein
MRRLLALLGSAIAVACGTLMGEDPPLPVPDRIEDAGIDGPVDAASGFCATNPADFCADFDTTPRWWGFDPARAYVEPAARAALDGTQQGFVSPPNALLARANVVPGDDAGALNQLAVKTIPIGASRKASLSFSLRPLAGIDQPYVAVASLSLDAQRYYALVYSGSKLTITRAGLPNADFSATPPPGTWARVRIEVDLAAGTLEAYVDDALVVPSSQGFTTNGTDTELGIAFGLSLGAPPAIGTEVQFDDVLLKWR